MLGRQTVANVIEIGRRLTEAKAIAGHGGWLPWLETEFGWTEMTATRFMNVASKSNKLLDLEVPMSGLYLLARAPDSATEEIIERVELGEKLIVADIERAIGRREDQYLGRTLGLRFQYSAIALAVACGLWAPSI